MGVLVTPSRACCSTSKRRVRESLRDLGHRGRIRKRLAEFVRRSLAAGILHAAPVALIDRQLDADKASDREYSTYRGDRYQQRLERLRLEPVAEPHEPSPGRIGGGQAGEKRHRPPVRCRKEDRG